MKKLNAVCAVILCLNISLCYSTSTSEEKVHGPNPGPAPIKTIPPNHRNRFLTHFQRSAEEKEQIKSGGNVKIVEGLSKTITATPSSTSILKRNPSPHFTKSSPSNSDPITDRGSKGTTAVEKESSQISKRLGNVRRDDYSDEQAEIISSGYNSYGPPPPQYPSPGPAPVFPNTPKPIMNYNNYNNQYNHRPNPPAIVNYYPTTGGGGGGPLPPIVFPAQPYPGSYPGPQPQPGPQPGPEPTPDPLPAVVVPPEPVGPPNPISPPSGTVVPIIGGGENGGAGTDEEGEEVHPPSPPEDIFPPSPPEIESVGRSLPSSLPLKSNSQNVVRTRITPVGTVPVRTLTRERESGSVIVGSTPTRIRSGETHSTNQGSRKIVRVRQRDKVRESIESNTSDEQQQLRSVGEDPNIITDFVFSDIKCFKTRNREYFGATIHMKSGYHPPYVRDRPQDPLTSNECHMEGVPGSDDVFHMTVTDLKACGVETCGDYMCLTMVFPRVPTLALADDEVTTIKCLPQKSTMSDTRTISFAGDSLDLRRSSSTVEGGGHDFAAEVGVFRQNPGAANGLFVKRVNSGGVVQLGEPLQLRSIVRGGDGWKHSKLSDVKVWRMRDAPGGNLDNLDPNDASEVITLVDGEGCRNDEYQVIADRHPLKDPRNDLINHFNFKAFLFRGQRANEPLVLTAKVHACQDNVDCVPKTCEFSRSKRSPVELHNASSIIHDWDSRLAIRVVGLNDQSASLSEEDFPTDFSSQGRSLSSSSMSCAEKMATAGLGGGLIVLFLCGIALALYAYVVKGRSSSKTRSNRSHPPFLENGPPPPMRNHHHSPNAVNPPHRNNTFPTKNSSPNKPLPPPPPQHGESSTPENEKVSKSDITNVAKILQRLADKGDIGGNDQATEYACIDENSSTSTSTSSSSGERNVNTESKKAQLGRKKSDGVYIVYVDNKKNSPSSKGHRPKSAPPSLRGKSRKQMKDKLRKQCIAEIFPDSNSETQDQTEDAATEESDSSFDSSGSDGVGNRGGGGGKCVGFVGRRTVRDVKSRSSHHHRDSHHFASQKQNVVKGIRRRLSSLYKDGKQGLGLGSGGGNNGNKAAGGSFPTRWKAGPGSGQQQLAPCDENYSTQQHSSDLDSAYYGSEFNDDLLHEMRELASQHRRSRKCYGGPPSTKNMTNTFPENDKNNNSTQNPNLCKVKMQLQNSRGNSSPPLERGETKAAHFVTRNENSTQILIVPETHV